MFFRPLLVFSAGLTLGALVTASALWVLSGLAAPIPNVAANSLLLSALALLLLRDLGLIRLKLPQTNRQVPQSVLRRPGMIPAFQFGIELGTGVRTYAPAAAPYMIAVAIPLLGVSWPFVLTAACGFALGRAAMPATRLLSGDVDAWDRLLERRLSWLVPGSAATTAALLAVTMMTA